LVIPPAEWSARCQDLLAVVLGSDSMHNEFSAIIEHDGEWYIAYSPEIPGANGQGQTKEEARRSLAAAIALILEDRREDALRGVPADALRETVTVE
jgi:predicted RNase H-like HicB family nuclease